MSHDQLFKELLRAFFREFLELFYPEVAGRLNFDRVSFLDKEVFTDFPEGSLREADLVAQAHTLEGTPELILVHIEVQAQRGREFPFRMFEYYALLRLRHRMPVFPVAVYLAPGAGGLCEETYAEGLFGTTILNFRYCCIGLPDLPAEEYFALENPVAPALSALMKRRRLSRALHKISTQWRTVRAPLDEARKALLLNIIETYLPLDEDDQEEYRLAAGQENLREVRQMLTVYEERGIVKGIEQGIKQGLEQGIVRGKQDLVLKQLRIKFGELPEGVVAGVQHIEDETDLDRLSERLLTAASLQELGLGAPE